MLCFLYFSVWWLADGQWVRRLLGQHVNYEPSNFIITLNQGGVGWFYSALHWLSASPTVFCYRPARWWRPRPAAIAGRPITSSFLSVSWSANRCPTSPQHLPSWSQPFWHITGPSTCRRPSITQRPSPVQLQVRIYTCPSSHHYRRNNF